MISSPTSTQPHAQQRKAVPITPSKTSDATASLARCCGRGRPRPVRARPRALRYDFIPNLHPTARSATKRRPHHALKDKRRDRFTRTLLRPGTAALRVRPPRAVECGDRSPLLAAPKLQRRRVPRHTNRKPGGNWEIRLPVSGTATRIARRSPRFAWIVKPRKTR